MEWVENIFQSEPRWTVEPEISAITVLARRQLGCGEGYILEVSPFSANTFNKLYLVMKPDGKEYLMRIAMPVFPSSRPRVKSPQSIDNYVDGKPTRLRQLQKL